MASPTSPPDRPDPDSIAERLKKQFGDHVEPTLPLDPEPAPDKDAPSSLFDKLRGAGTRGTRYKLLGEVARGGMGVILKIWDDELRRTLAMKVVLGRGDESKGDTPQVDPKTLGRFLEEAQVTGQLDHPGIVPVHELGLGADGRVYFTMRLVKGEDLRSIFEKVRTGEDGWNQVRALGVLLKVCEAMSYAHSKKVVHRDLKPANVMVGKFGEVYVMDWGLARVLGREDKHDLRIQPQPTTQSVVKTERRESREETPDSPLVTMDGDIVGTPSFMPPEQAMGQLEKLGPHSDVYSLGAMLYQLLTGEMPYVPAGARMSARTVLLAVIGGPPPPIRRFAPKTRAELVAICEKAMAREPSGRYADTQEFAADLRAYLEDRVVRAYESGKWAETRKWIQRNRPRGVALRIVVVLLCILVVNRTIASVQDRNRVKEITGLRDEAVAQAHELRVRGLIQDLAAFDSEDDAFGGPHLMDPRGTEWWLDQAHQLVDGVDRDSTRWKSWWSPGLRDVEAALARVRERAMSAEEAAPLAMLPRAFTVAGSKADPDLLKWRFKEINDERWHAELVDLRNALLALRAKLAMAERSVHSAEASSSWTTAIEAIASSGKYRGVKWPRGDRLTPQLGLVPIGADPASGLWEFSHLDSGEAASRAADGTIVLNPEMGLVFVLLPGGRVPIEDGKEPTPLNEIDLDPFFLSKYEMTIEQWGRVNDRPIHRYRIMGVQLPVNAVSWHECVDTLEQRGMWVHLPSAAQWEYGCRAWTTTPWWTGATAETLRGAANLQLDASPPSRTPGSESSFWLDARNALRPVGSLRANAFGLHDVHGNVVEWCQDVSGGDVPPREGDALIDSGQPADRVVCGGSFDRGASNATSGLKWGYASGLQIPVVGLRPARALTP